MAWHRRLIARKCDGSKQRGRGPPRTKDEIQQLVVRMATENRDRGYRRIQGALANLGYEVSRGKIANILKEHSLEPAPERERKTTWKEFLSRYFPIDLSSRRVQVAGVTRDANSLWMSQTGANSAMLRKAS
jgi:putative transposase